VLLLANGQPPRAVGVLFAMHLAIALVTYNCLVHIAKAKPAQMPRQRPGTSPESPVAAR
jgi:hypothetical protein